MSTLKQFIGTFKISFLSQLRTPSAWAFGFLFPAIFVVLFAYVGINNNPEIKVGFLEDDSQAYIQIKKSFEEVEIYSIQESRDLQDLQDQLDQSDLDGVIFMETTTDVVLLANQNNPENIGVIQETLAKVNIEYKLSKLKDDVDFFSFETREINSREVEYIDFVLPGILGYSLMASAIFGVAFSFLSLRKKLVLKRIFAAPTSISIFVLAQSLSRFCFIFAQNIALILLASLFFGYEPVNGLSSYVQILFIMALGLIVFLGFGYIVAGVAKSDDAAAPLANLLVVPQLILAGTFFPIEYLPNWLATISKIMPLYHFNSAIRAVSLEGNNLFEIGIIINLGTLIGWGFINYIIASKVFSIK